jgi:hypothetical protein
MNFPNHPVLFPHNFGRSIPVKDASAVGDGFLVVKNIRAVAHK